MLEEKSTILVVDDTPENIDILSGILHDTYKVKVALNGQRALAIAQKKPHPDMILLDVMMPEMDGYEVCSILKKNPATANIPVIFITAMNDEQSEEKGLNLGAVDYIFKPISPSITKSRIKTHLALFDQNRELERQVYVRTKELVDSRLEIIKRLGRAAEYKDNETGLHVIRMSYYARLIAESFVGEANKWTELVFHSVPMHDIGKIGIPDKVLLKPGKLDSEEWALMQKHSEFGSDIIGEHDSDLLKMAKEIAHYHHEKWDGSGYPQGLKGEAIPLSARVAAIADVFDALTSERPYKDAWSIDKTISFIKENAGTHFDPELVGHFELVIPRIIEIKDTFCEEME
jgi:putative two-component system response regulator